MGVVGGKAVMETGLEVACEVVRALLELALVLLEGHL